jgi:hypothetical protein
MPSPLIRALGLAAPRPHIEGCLHDNDVSDRRIKRMYANDRPILKADQISAPGGGGIKNSHDRAVDGQLNLLPDCQLLFWHRLKCERGGIHLLEAPMPRW